MSFKILTIMTFLLGSVNALANDAAPHGSAAASAQAMKTTDKYTNSWISFPALTLKNIDTAEPQALPLTKGRVQIVVFLASWCVPCQQLMPEMKRIAEKYKGKYTDISYVFAHDTDPDARAFASYHKVMPASYMGTAKVLEDFHQPDLPAIYASDRYGWLAYRKLNSRTTDLPELEKYLELHTSF
ncbi:MAG: TlpA family protein disulfide reductase [Proteobacteria bacterium]|nr:MAG: TlpA family protein disulfide reductase [Pseudomonadota bacterium]